MTWTVQLTGHDNLEGGEKASFENGLVEKVQSLVDELKGTEGCNVTSASVSTNTTGGVNLLSGNS
jgi:hypothetical protein